MSLLSFSRASLYSVLSAMIVACGSTDNSASENTAGSTADQSDESVFDPMTGTLDRAAGVEDLSTSRKEDMDQAIEASE